MSSIHAQAIDFKGLPADKSKTGGWIPAGLILGKCWWEHLIAVPSLILLNGIEGYPHLPHLLVSLISFIYLFLSVHRN